ncbi:mpv17-like protein 2 [Erpetoichthys calabaricus]|uniref:mpv17-like protein 2 n=1 Tax=Erpetoichthys calabaricus TaxID=27687 RepID=UPI002234B169|nr:mpv17-like protein 2 [Erpetoichthys calabaricus]
MLLPGGKQLLMRLSGCWKPLLNGRLLLVTNTVSCGAILATGDIIQQTLERRKLPGKPRSWARTGRMFAIGCSMGPVLHFWYSWLDRMYTGKTLAVVTKKVLIDQLVASPTFGGWYFVGMGILEGHSAKPRLDEFVCKFWEFYKADWCVWPPAQMFNFYFLPAKFRVIFVNIVTLDGTRICPYIKHRDPELTNKHSGTPRTSRPRALRGLKESEGETVKFPSIPLWVPAWDFLMSAIETARDLWDFCEPQ